jgi:uncharacterized coiled-coil DUF342 family protein
MSKKQAYEEKFKAQLDELSAKIDVLKAKAKQAEASVKTEYYATIDELLKKRTEAQNRLEDLREAGDGAWEDMKQGVEESWAAFSAAVKAAASRFQ